MIAIRTTISKSLYEQIIREKRRLEEQEKSKYKSRRRRVTFTIACQSLCKRIR